MSISNFIRQKMLTWLQAGAMALAGLFLVGAAQAADPASLKDVPTPVPKDVTDFNHPKALTETIVKDQAALVRLGKALFWDMQVGGDGVQACASCHFNAGADTRNRNQLSPGILAGDTTLFGNSAIPGVPGHPEFTVDRTMVLADFPFHQRDPATAPVVGGARHQFDTVVRDTNDVMSSMGILYGLFLNVIPGVAVDNFSVANDPIALFQGFRRVEPRNTPTTINALFNFDNFWDGRASAIFNGRTPHGFRNREVVMKKKSGSDLVDVKLRITNSSLASQAVGPPLSEFEMSFDGRSWPEVGKKMLSLKPLAYQAVSATDSVLGGVVDASGTGLSAATYLEMVEDAFKNVWWANTAIPIAGPGGPFTQAEYNFSMFFGLAVQAYELTLRADDTPFDNGALTDKQKRGLDIFRGTNEFGGNPELADGRCNNCHRLPETTNHSVRNIQPNEQGVPQDIIEPMIMGDGKSAFYDNGMYNISRRPTEEDIARDGTGGTINPKTGEPFPLSYVKLALLKAKNKLPADVAKFVQDLPAPNCDSNADGSIDGFLNEGICVPAPAKNRVAVRGSFKSASLRNLLYTGPYFHEGGDAKLRHVVEFYTRGGNFPVTNRANLDPDIAQIPLLDVTQKGDDNAAKAEARIDALVDFLAFGLLDDRVARESAPFDHPQLFVPAEGDAGRADEVSYIFTAPKFKVIPAVGAAGNGAPSIDAFLGLDTLGEQNP